MDLCLSSYGFCNYVSGKHATIFFDKVFYYLFLFFFLYDKSFQLFFGRWQLGLLHINIIWPTTLLIEQRNFGFSSKQKHFVLAQILIICGVIIPQKEVN